MPESQDQRTGRTGRSPATRTFRLWPAAADPGHLRLASATASTTIMALSTISVWLLVHFFHADQGLLAFAAIIALQFGVNVKDPTARGRLVTTAILAVPVIGGLSAATLLSQRRQVEIIVFIALVGIATWVRRFGPRWSAIGTLAFFSYFFILVLQPKMDQLPVFLLAGACVSAAATLVRAVLLVQRPQRQIDLLLYELRVGSTAALTLALRPDVQAKHPQWLRNRLARIDQVGLAITTWQSRFDTARYIDCAATDFTALVFDARFDTEHVCSKLTALLGSVDDPAKTIAQLGRPVDDLFTVLDEHSLPDARRSAATRARDRLGSGDCADDLELLRRFLARATISQQELRNVVLTHGLDTTPARRTSSPSHAPVPAAPPATGSPTGSRDVATHDGPAPRRWPWDRWSPNTRMTIQATVAAVIATYVGEAISGSRWYWAVLTAFLVFVGGSTRGAILTKASRRVVGTVLGIAVGIGLAVAAGSSQAALIAICVACVFGMLYFGPLQYLYSSFFITVFLVGMYGLLGILTSRVLEVRIAETVGGAFVGVLCAYLIVSTSSRDKLGDEVSRFFAALDHVLEVCSTALTENGRAREVLDTTRRFDAVRADIDSFVSGMNVAFYDGRSALSTMAVHLMYITNRAAGELARAAVAVTSGDSTGLLRDAAGDALDRAVDHVRKNAGLAQHSLDTRTAPAVDLDDSTILDLLEKVPFDGDSPQVEAFRALAQMNWALLRVTRARRSFSPPALRTYRHRDHGSSRDKIVDR